MNDSSLQRRIDGLVNVIADQHGSHWNQSTTECLGEDHHVGMHVVVMRGEKFPGSVHAGLHFIENEERAMFAAEICGIGNIMRVRDANTGFGLNGLKDERRELSGLELFFQATRGR